MSVHVDGRARAPEGDDSLDRAFAYGDAVFETFRVRGGRVLRLSAHLARLRHSAACLDLDVDEPALRRELAEALAAYGEGSPEAASTSDGAGDLAARLTLVRASAPGFAPTTSRAVRVVSLAPAPKSAVCGLPVRCVTRQRSVAPALLGAKVVAYTEAVALLVDARAEGADDVIGLDAYGHVLEATTANVFVRIAGELVTPPPAQGVLDGVTRRTVLDLARACGLEPRERPLPVSELYRADEVLLTSSVRGVRAVAAVDGVRFAQDSGLSGALTRARDALFDSEAECVDAALRSS